MTWEEYAQNLINRWRERQPGSSTLSYIADKCYYQASTLLGFTGSSREWIDTVEAMHAGTMLPTLGAIPVAEEVAPPPPPPPAPPTKKPSALDALDGFFEDP